MQLWPYSTQGPSTYLAVEIILVRDRQLPGGCRVQAAAALQLIARLPAQAEVAGQRLMPWLAAVKAGAVEHGTPPALLQVRPALGRGWPHGQGLQHVFPAQRVHRCRARLAMLEGEHGEGRQLGLRGEGLPARRPQVRGSGGQLGRLRAAAAMALQPPAVGHGGPGGKCRRRRAQQRAVRATCRPAALPRTRLSGQPCRCSRSRCCARAQLGPAACAASLLILPAPQRGRPAAAACRPTLGCWPCPWPKPTGVSLHA